MVRAYIGLGSNLGESLQTLQSALQHLDQHENIQVNAQSRFYGSKPVGPQDQPDYINAVVAVETTLDAHDLLAAMLHIEKLHGRDRENAVRWGARTLDLDLLLYGNSTIQADHLTVPHPYLTERSFVVVPLMDIAPDLVLPNGEILAQHFERHQNDELVPLES